MLASLHLDALLPLITVIAIDLALSADNAIVIGLAAAALPMEQRRKAIVWGTLAAAALRIGLSIIAVQLLNVLGLLLAGGLLLLYVSWKLWWDLKGHQSAEHEAHEIHLDGVALRKAVLRIVLADLSMSIENILGVAGAARDHIAVLIVGLTLSIVLTGTAAAVVSRLLARYAWLGYLGVLMIVWVALKMIWDGGHSLLVHFAMI
jgi:YjbE family integral membrane protein